MRQRRHDNAAQRQRDSRHISFFMHDLVSPLVVHGDPLATWKKKMRNTIILALAAIALANVVTPASAYTIVRDHRDPPVVRDHRHEPIVRDHRNDPIVRDHR
jgi:hypothetical protein